MTNGGLSINAELFMMLPTHPTHEPNYLIQLNCAWAWAPLEATRSPLVMFLRDANPLADDPTKVPLFFNRIEFAA